MNKKIIWGIILIILATGLIMFFKNRTDNDGEYYKVGRSNVSNELVFAGIVDAERRVDLGFAAGGRVIKNKVKEGDFVKKGQLLAELDQSSIRAGLVQANANYQLTKIDTQSNANNSNISYEELKKQQDTIVENLKQQYLSGDLQAYLVDEDLYRPISVPVVSGNYIGEKEGKYIVDVYRSAALSNYSFHLSGLETLTQTAEVFQPGQLGTKGLYIKFNSGENYRDKIFEIPVPNTRSTTYLSRKTAYENAIATRERVLSDAKNNLDKLTKKDSSSNISYSDARIQNARAQINASAIRLSDGKIRAPFSGYIVKNNLEIGETVQALSSQITMFANKKKKLILNTPEIYINKIHVGDSVSISLDAYPDITFEGEITKIDDIDTLADGVPVYQTEVMFSGEDERLRVGMNAHAEIIATEVKDVIAIPKHFIKKDADTNIVTVVTDDGLVEKNIEIGIVGNNGLVEVISGLNEGQSIVRTK
jgi:RND family efflux transporter MFP subunit